MATKLPVGSPFSAKHAQSSKSTPALSVVAVGGGLLTQAKRMLKAAKQEPLPSDRFSAGYAAALRTAAAVLAARGRPHRGRSRPTSAWNLLETVAPELQGWAKFFAHYSAVHSAVQAGITGRVTDEVAEEFLVCVEKFMFVVHRSIYERG